MRKTKLHTGVVVASQIQPNEPSADSLFRLFGLTRKKYIQNIAALMRAPYTDPFLINLIEIAMKEQDIDRIEEWEETFDSSHLWVSYTHMRILAELYDQRIMLYQLDQPIDEEVPASEAMFVPLVVAKPQNRVIGKGPIDMHIAVVNAHFVNQKQCHVPLQFEQLFLTEEPSLRPYRAISMTAQGRSNESEIDGEEIDGEIPIVWDTDIQGVLWDWQQRESQ